MTRPESSSSQFSSLFKAKALAHWTPEREAKVTGGKAWPLLPSEAPELLRTIGLLNGDGTLSADAVRKLAQVNHMITLLQPTLSDLRSRHATLRILDAGCGTSAMTLILGWLLREKERHDVQILGVDSNAAVIATSARRAAELGLSDSVRFVVSPLRAESTTHLFSTAFPETSSTARKPPRAHLILGLHACDQATDMALAMGILGEADAMAVAPCCHAELASFWKDLKDPHHPMAPIFASPNLRRETAAQMTDALRMVITRRHGYEVTATEFVPSAHTPKNRLLLAIRRGRYQDTAATQVQRLKATLGQPTLALERALNQSCPSATPPPLEQSPSPDPGLSASSHKSSGAAIDKALDALATQGWAVMERGLPESLCQDLRDLIEAKKTSGVLHRAGVGQGPDFRLDPSIRGDAVAWLPSPADPATPAERALLDVIEEWRIQVNRALFLGLWDFEGHLAHYPPGGHYAKHLDRFSGKGTRTLSLVIYLNPSWSPSDGGLLRLYDPNDSDRIVAEVPPMEGTVVLFLSGDIPHEVTTCQTSRYSVAGWYRTSGSPLA